MDNSKKIKRSFVDDISKSNRLPIQFQAEAAECGLVCLAMIASFYGRHMDISSLRRRFNISLKGTTLQQLIDIANNFGLTSRPLRAELYALPSISVPAILHWEMNHFVVLSKATSRYCIIHDPARGKIKISTSQLSKYFTGVAVEFIPAKTFEKKSEVSILRITDFWSRAHGLKRALVQALLLTTFLQFFSLVVPFFQQLMVDEAISKYDSGLLVSLVVGFVMLGLINTGINWLRANAMIYFSSAINFQMRLNLFRHLMRLPVEYFEKRHVGDITSRFGSLVPIGSLFTSGFIAAILDGVMAIATLILALTYSVKLTFAILGFLAFLLVLELAVFPYRKRKNEDILNFSAKEESNFLESIRNARAIKIFGQELTRESQWQSLSIDTINSKVTLAKFNLNFGLVTSLAGISQMGLVFYMGGSLVIEGAMSLGMLFAYQAYSSQFSSRIIGLIGQLISFKLLKLHLSRLSDIVQEEPEYSLGLAEKPKVADNLKGEITLNSVAYKYGEYEPWVIKNIDLRVRAGEMLAITGKSGIGKSTLLKIMIGLMKPTQGEVYIDSTSISSLEPSRYRRMLGVVMQDDSLLSGTIADNITFFDPEVSNEEMLDATNLAFIHSDIVAMPMGYDTLVGELGTTLSGGQKQRLLLARALYRKPKILILDEGTANLDMETEQLVAKAIANLSITRIVVSHRPALIQMADRVVSFHGNELKEASQTNCS